MASLYDSHTHVYSEEFDVDRDAVFERAFARQVQMLLMPATDTDSIQRAIAVNQEYPGVTKMAFGLHPESVDHDYKEKLSSVYHFLEQHYDSSALVAIGEIGLDFYWDTTFRHEQIVALEEQLQWAIDLKLPVILHTRSAHKEMVSLVAKYAPRGLRGVFHSFTGSEEELSELLQFEGFMVGVNGIVTFKKSEELRRVVAKIPLDRLLLETDAPYLAPVPWRGKRNEPSFVAEVAKTLSELLRISFESLLEHTFCNAERLFERKRFTERDSNLLIKTF